jgi:hypothetical protein
MMGQPPSVNHHCPASPMILTASGIQRTELFFMA